MSDPLFINVSAGAPEYNALELRRAMATLMYPATHRQGARGGVRPGSVPASVSGTTWTVHDLCAVIYPGLTSTSGPYLVGHAEESGSLDPADGTNDRIDALDLQIQDNDEDGSGFRRSRVVYTAGVPGGSAPAQAANSIRLATILVPSGGSPSPSITVVTPWTVAAGGILPVDDSTELPSTANYRGKPAWLQDSDELWVFGTAGWTFIAKAGGGFGVVGYDDLTAETAVSGTSAPGTLLCSTSVAVTTDRRYRVTGKTRWRVDSAGDRIGRLTLLAGGSTVGISNVDVSNQTAANGPMDHVTRQVFVPTSDATIDFDLYGFRTSGATSLLTASSTGVPTELLVEDIGPSA